MKETEKILDRIREKQNVMIVSDSQKRLESLFDELCAAGYGKIIMPLFEAEYSKRELTRELGQCLTDVHRKREPLGKSILEVKRLLEHSKGEVLECELSHIGQLTEEEVKVLAAVVEEYGVAVQKTDCENCDESWDGVRVQECTDELKVQIKKVLQQMQKVIGNLNNIEGLQRIAAGSSLSFNWESIENLLTICEKSVRLQNVPAFWMYQQDLIKLKDMASDYRKQCYDYRTVQENIGRKYNPEVFNLDGAGMEAVLCEGIRKLREMIHLQGRNDGFILDNLRHFASRADGLKRALKQVQQYASDVEERTRENKDSALVKKQAKAAQDSSQEIENQDVRASIDKVTQAWKEAESWNPLDEGMRTVHYVQDIEHNLFLCKAILGNLNPCDTWLEDGQAEEIIYELGACEKQCLEIQKIMYRISEVHNESVFQLPCEELLSKFQHTYQSVLGRLKGSYRQDRERILNTYQHPVDNLTDEVMIELLNMLCLLQEKREWLRSRKQFLIENIGAYYHGEHTNWVIVKEDIRQFQVLVAYFDKKEKAFQYLTSCAHDTEQVQKFYDSLIILKRIMREELAEYCSEQELASFPLNQIQAILKQKVKKEDKEQTSYQEPKVILNEGDLDVQKLDSDDRLRQIEADVKVFLRAEQVERIPVSEQRKRLGMIIETCRTMDEQLMKLKGLCKRPEHADLLLEDLKQVRQMQQTEQRFQIDNEEKRTAFGKLYQGIVTDWNQVWEQIELAQSMRQDVKKYHLLRSSVEELLDVESADIDLYDMISQLSEATVHKNDFAFLDHLFEEEYNLYKMPFDRLHTKLMNCMNSIENLEQWMGYQSARRKCERYGLLSFLSEAKKMGVTWEEEFMVQSFYKTFYQKWLSLEMEQEASRYCVKCLDEITEMQQLEEEKTDIRKLEIEDYLEFVPHWLSRIKPCLLVKGEAIESYYYQRILISDTDVQEG